MSTIAIPAVGAPAPDFTASTDSGATLSLADLRGRPVVLYFYPRDDTPTCSAQACEFRDQFPRFDAAGAVVVGVSTDTVRSHARFREKYALPFTLVADPDHAIAEAWGVWQEKSMYGRKYMGIVRTTFLVDARGRIARVWERVRTKGHGEDVAQAVAAL